MSVSSTGHHQDVRNLVDNGFHLDMKHFNSVRVEPNRGVVRVGTAATFEKIFQEVARETNQERCVASGSDKSVGPYGWTVGGGYGRLTKLYVGIGRLPLS